MKQVSVRMPESMVDRLEKEAEEKEMGLAEHIRDELRDGNDDLRERLEELEEETEKHRELFSRRLEMLDDLAKRVEDLEEQPDQETATVDVDHDGAADADPKDDEISLEEPAETIDEAIEGWPEYGKENRERRREVGRQAVEWLRERDEPASGGDFKDALFDRLPVADQNPSTWWRKSVRPAVQRCVDAGLVEYREGHHDYRWTGSE